MIGSGPCKQPEAMVKIINFVELPIVCGAPLRKPEGASSGFPYFYSFKKADMIIVQGMKRKISSSSLQWARDGSKTMIILSVGQFF